LSFAFGGYVLARASNRPGALGLPVKM
jgi:hypothetical protein